MARGRVVGHSRLATRSPRRQTAWFDMPPAVNTLTVAGGTIIYSLNAAALALRPFTVVRTHMLLQFESDQIAALERYVGAFSFAVVSDEASATGVAAVPTPITEQGSDLFFLWQGGMGRFAFTTGVAYIEAGHQYVVDSKAMRKVDLGQDEGENHDG